MALLFSSTGTGSVKHAFQQSDIDAVADSFVGTVCDPQTNSTEA
jgi:hypothetical protein